MNVQVENLQKSFFLNRGLEIKALRDIQLEIQSGQSISIIGPSGAGKSTLLHLLGLMDRPTGGKIIFDRQDFSRSSDSELTAARRTMIGFLFQLHYLLPDFTVWENVLLPVWNDRSIKKSKALDLLERLGLKDRFDHMPSELSGGEQQRVALARALINAPKLLMADEPTGNLDRETGEKVEEIIFSECKSNNITLIIVTHNPELADRADRIVKMRDGMIIE